MVLNYAPIINEPIVQSFVLFFLSFATLKTLYEVVIKNYKRLTSKTKTDFDDELFNNLTKPVNSSILFISMKAAVIPLTQYSLVKLFDQVINSILIIISAWIGVRVTETVLNHWWKRSSEGVAVHVLPILHKTVKGAFGVVAFLMVLSSWQIDVTSILASLGVAGLAMGLGLQDTLKNVFGGFQLVLDKSFKVGDKIQIESGEVGVVHDIGLRSTKIRTYNNEIIIVPNSQLANMRILNFALPEPKQRFEFDISIAYGEKIERAMKTIKELLDKEEGLLRDPEPAVILDSFGESSINLKVRFWTHDYNVGWDIKRDLMKKVYDEFNKKGIEIPFPTRTVFLKKS